MNANKKNDMTDIDIKQMMDVMSIVCNKLDDQAIQLSAIAAQVLEQNEKLNEITPQSEYIGTKELERRFDIKERSQKSYRGRIKNPLPYHQDIENGKVVKRTKMSEITELELQRLEAKYTRALSKKEIAHELGDISIRTLDRRIESAQDIPSYIKSKTGHVVFPISAVVIYFSEQLIRTA